MKIFATTLALFLYTTLLIAQEDIKIKYRKVSAEELNMKQDIADSSADAILLYDKAEITFGYDGLSGMKIITNYHLRYKILKKSALDIGIIKIPYISGSYNEKEVITNIEGFTYNIENGKMVESKLTKESIFHERITDEKYQEKISMPNIKVGSVFEYRYTRETPMNIMDHPPTWYFQSSIPVKWSELEITIPNKLVYRTSVGGYLNFYIKHQSSALLNIGGQQENATNYLYVVKDAPAFHDEPFISSSEDYISKINLELITINYTNGLTKRFTETWENLIKTVLDFKFYKDALTSTTLFRTTAGSFLPIKDTLESINKAFNFITKNFKWDNSISLSPHEYSKKIYDNKSGNSAALNLMLIMLLREMNLDANPLILSTRDHGRINPNAPMLDEFNYMITCVTMANGKDIVMDASDRFSKPGMLPIRCLSGNGRLVKLKDSRFVSLIPTEKKATMCMINAEFEAISGTMAGTINTSYNGYDAHIMREEIYTLGKEDFLKKVKKDNIDTDIANIKIENEDENDKALKISYDFEVSSLNNPNVIYLNPILFDKHRSNPFKQSTRIYPVDLAVASDKSYVAIIKIPEGYVPEEIPKPAVVTLPDNTGKFSYNIDVSNNTIRVTSRVTLNECYFHADEYQLLKDLYDLIINKHSEQLILRKK